MHKKKVLILGGGFAGLTAAQRLDASKFEITLLDQNNYHLFQPLLYQVATGSLAAPDVATPLRTIVTPAQVRVVQEEAVSVDDEEKLLRTASGNTYAWDILILAMGLGHSFFGHDEWAEHAPSLKFLDDAFAIRNKLLTALEREERADKSIIEARGRPLRFVVVGGGPTGVELAGAVGELTGRTLAREFSSFDPRQTEILLIEAGSRVLPQYDEEASREATAQLVKLGVSVLAQTSVLSIDSNGLVVISEIAGERRIDAEAVIWAAGASATQVTGQLCKDLQMEVVKGGRIKVDDQFRVPGRADIYVVGDLALYLLDAAPLPGLAPVAERAGAYVASILNGDTEKFTYSDKGQLAVIGRNAAVGRVFGRSVNGMLAWWLWLIVHIRGLIGFDTKLKVMLVWAWKFVFDKYGARIVSAENKAGGTQVEGGD